MAIKETPTNFRVYYKQFIKHNKQKLEDSLKLLEELKDDIEVRHKNILMQMNLILILINI